MFPFSFGLTTYQSLVGPSIFYPYETHIYHSIIYHGTQFAGTCVNDLWARPALMAGSPGGSDGRTWSWWWWSRARMGRECTRWVSCAARCPRGQGHGARPLARGVACARVRSPAALRVPAGASLEGQLGIPVMWVTWWLPTSRAPPPGRGPEVEGRKLLHSAHARREAWAPWHALAPPLLAPADLA